jgi:hypothetical protein
MIESGGFPCPLNIVKPSLEIVKEELPTGTEI